MRNKIAIEFPKGGLIVDNKKLLIMLGKALEGMTNAAILKWKSRFVPLKQKETK